MKSVKVDAARHSFSRVVLGLALCFAKIETRNHRTAQDNAMSPTDLAWADNAPGLSAHEQAMAHYMINGSRPGKTLFKVVSGKNRPIVAGELLLFLTSHCI